MNTLEIQELQEEADIVNQIYDIVNQKKSTRPFYNTCKEYNMDELLEQWDFENNLLKLGITVHTISKSSGVRPYWFCEKHNQSYRCGIDAKVRDKDATQCTLCIMEKRRATKTEKMGSLLDWCLENGEYGKQLIKEWNAEKNQKELGIDINRINYNSSQKVFWKCTYNHEWECSIESRTIHRSGSCPQCLKQRRGDKQHETVLRKRNFLLWCQNNGEVGERLIREWDTEKNKECLHLSMEEITPNYMQKVHWKCEKGHEFQVTPYYRTYYKSRCPMCSHKSRRGKDLQKTHPDLVKEWDYSKNEKLPEEYSGWSQERVWWKCPKCGHEWYSMISGRAQQGTGCPRCHHRWTS